MAPPSARLPRLGFVSTACSARAKALQQAVTTIDLSKGPSAALITWLRLGQGAPRAQYTSRAHEAERAHAARP